VLKKIGAGAFGEIYSGKNIITNELVAIKVERVDSKKQVLKLEVAVLKKLQACPYVCRFITCGRFNEYNYMIMELLGENISELRRRQPDGKFSMGSSLKLGMQMLKALEAVHDLGYIHRDVKPSNFAMGLSGVKRHVAFLIDFGLARRYILSSGEVRPPRDSTGFRGTARYASINSHLSKDLGRRDDIWSIFYMLIEFVQGQLPWRKLKDKDQIGEMKIKYNTPEIVKDLPPQFLAFMKHLKTLNYGDRPDYNYLQTILSDLYHSLGCDEHTPFDWELNPLRSPNTSAYPLISSHEAEYSRDYGVPRAHGNGLNNHSAANLFNNYNTSASSALRPAVNNSVNNEDEPSQERSVHSQHDGNSHRSRRDTGSAAAAAAAQSSEKEHTGSWNQKSSPRTKPANIDRQHADNTNPGDVHIKIVDKEGNSNNNLQSALNANTSGPSQHPPPKDAMHTTCCAKCIIM
jgi:tau tubulin kinase